jgi:uncharacterized protein YjbI with pentapeptide repeats
MTEETLQSPGVASIAVDPVSKKAALDKTRAETAKLRVERRVLAFQLSRRGRHLEFFKVIASFGTLVGIVATLAAAGISSWQWSESFRASVVDKAQDRLQSTLAKLKDPAEGARFGATLSLQAILPASADIDRNLIFQSLLAAVATEPSFGVRSSIVNMFADLHGGDTAALSQLVTAAITLDRSIMQDATFLPSVKVEGVSKIETNSAEARELSLAQIILSLLRSGARPDRNDMHGIYCRECDFSGLTMNGYDLSDSYLERSKFHDTLLIGAHLSRSDLAYADFNCAKAMNADFSSYGPMTDKYWDTFELLQYDSIDFILPSFAHANLTKAVFSGFPMIFLYSQTSRAGGDQGGTLQHFADATLDGAIFANLSALRAKNFGEGEPPELNYVYRKDEKHIEINEDRKRVTYFGESDKEIEKDVENEIGGGDKYSKSRGALVDVLSGADWTKAVLVPELRYTLTHVKGSSLFVRAPLVGCLSPPAQSAPRGRYYK